MIGNAVSYSGSFPGTALGWVVQTGAGPWIPYRPAADWGDSDYRAAAAPPGSAFREGSVTTDSVFLASTSCEDRKKVLEKGFCTKFAGTKPTPTNILKAAATHGFLGRTPIQVLSKNEASLLILDWEEAADDEFELYVEPAADWLYLHSLMAQLLSAWGEGVVEMDKKEKLSKLLGHELEGGKLALEFYVDADAQRLRSELVATSFADALKIQLGLAMASEAVLRQCAECEGWFIVNPGVGRPDKRYCSRACKMRALRRRKTVR